MFFLNSIKYVCLCVCVCVCLKNNFYFMEYMLSFCNMFIMLYNLYIYNNLYDNSRILFLI